MKCLYRAVVCFFAGFTLITGAYATSLNQTQDVSPVLPSSGVPFRVVIEKANFQLPVGFHSGVSGTYKGLWVFLAGRLNGLHGFDIDNFPVAAQNRTIYVVDPSTGAVYSRSLLDPGSGLNQYQIDSLSVTSPESYQEDTTVYMAGGYGIDTATGTFGTKPILTAIYLPGIIQWVMQPGLKNNSVQKNIRQIANPIFQIAGGRMAKVGNVTQLIFGQNFIGNYTTSSNGIYSEQVRLFQIMDVKGTLSAKILPSQPQSLNPDFRRRDLNVVPVLMNKNNLLQYGYVAYSGVFTLDAGVWTVPVVIDEAGNSTEADPNSPASFKQAMSNYVCANIGFYSRKYSSMFNVFFGGISFGYFQNGTIHYDPEIPFINQITTIKMDQNGNFSQYLMDGQYPALYSQTVNRGNQLLFGAGAFFMPNTNLVRYPNKVISLDNIRQPVVIGYIVGGIMSTLPDTNFRTDSTASPYVFKVTIVPTD